MKKFEQLRRQIRKVLASAGVTLEDLLATLPEARERVYARHYGKKKTNVASRRRAPGKGEKSKS
ncbi:MAG: hypothetical protein WBQ72_10365 [Terriglobales bacterium]|jgi:hypothetical protein